MQDGEAKLWLEMSHLARVGEGVVGAWMGVNTIFWGGLI